MITKWFDKYDYTPTKIYNVGRLLGHNYHDDRRVFGKESLIPQCRNAKLSTISADLFSVGQGLGRFRCPESPVQPHIVEMSEFILPDSDPGLDCQRLMNLIMVVRHVYTSV